MAELMPLRESARRLLEPTAQLRGDRIRVSTMGDDVCPPPVSRARLRILPPPTWPQYAPDRTMLANVALCP